MKTLKELKENKEEITEKGPGLWANIRAKRQRIKSGSGERMKKPGEKGAPSPEALQKAKGTSEDVAEMDNRTHAGDRREKRANSPEALKQREKELQADLKKVSPEMRKKLRLPEPKKDMNEAAMKKVLLANKRKKMKEQEEAPSVKKVTKSGEPLSGKKEPIEINPEIENRK